MTLNSTLHAVVAIFFKLDIHPDIQKQIFSSEDGFRIILNSFVEVLRKEIKTMEERIIERIDHRFSELMGKRNVEEEEKVIILRSIPREVAKKEILELFNKYDKLDYGDIAEKLRLDLEEVVEIVEELEKEGEIEEVK